MSNDGYLAPNLFYFHTHPFPALLKKYHDQE